MACIVVVGAQWGDEGKGKVVDLLSEHADVVIRFQGGNNAGHTLVIGDNKVILHLIPSGILHKGKACVIGPGVVVDPEVLLGEMKELTEAGHNVSPNTVFISERAHVIMPYHKTIDHLRDTQRLGTTGRGIGPAYEDKIKRSGIRMIDIINKDLFKKKLDAIFEEKQGYIEKILESRGLDKDAIFDQYVSYGSQLKPFITNTSIFLNKALDQHKNLLFEGAQGALLDIDHGTYPFVTSSNTTAGFACAGTGIGPTQIDTVVGICKAYTTRVGEGPFPTELNDDIGERLRAFGGEYGATTGRPRRCGWLDLVALKHSVRLNSASYLAITKLDVLSGLDTIKVAVAYKTSDGILEDMPADLELYPDLEPVYEELPGWQENISDISSFDMLPRNCRNYIAYIEDSLNVKTSHISLGPERRQTIILKELF